MILEGESGGKGEREVGEAEEEVEEEGDEEDIYSIENSTTTITTPRQIEIDEENEDFFAGINRNRESILRASHDVNDREISNSPNKVSKRLSHSRLPNKDDLHASSSSSFIIENILAGSRENLLQNIGYNSENKERTSDPVLEGVSQMLSILKQHVQKTK